MVLVLLVFFTQKGICQKNNKIYFDQSFEEVDESDNYEYVGNLNGNKIKALDKDGNLAMEGQLDKKRRKHGNYIFYYKDGKKSSQGTYKDGQLDGYWKNWFTDGSMNNEGNYSRNEKIGIWNWYYRSGEKSCSENHSNKEKVITQCWDKNGEESIDIYSWNTRAYLDISDDSLKTFIINNIEYPEEAIKNEIEGIVKVSYIIEPSGEITNIEVVKSLSPEIDKEAIRIISLLPKYNPGRNYNRLVRTHFYFPITFKLTEEIRKR